MTREIEYRFPIYDGVVVVKARPDLKTLYVEPTTRCNLKCEMCFKQHWRNAEGDMDWALYLKLLDDALGFSGLDTIVFGGVGEPTLHPRFMDMVREALKHGFKIVITTNGTYLGTEKFAELAEMGVDLFYFSMDVLPSTINPFHPL